MDSVVHDKLLTLDLHYDFDTRFGVIHVLDLIERDLSSHRPIHNWDEKLTNDSVKSLAIYAKRELMRLEFSTSNYLLTYSSVNEVSTVNGMNYRHYAPERYLPNVKVWFPVPWNRERYYIHDWQDTKAALMARPSSSNTKSPGSAYGRIV